MNKYPCVESTVDFKHKDYEVRLWISEKQNTNNDYDELVELIRDLIDLHAKEGEDRRTFFIEMIVSKLKKNKINAVQVKYHNIDKEVVYGTVVYTVDFNSDFHG